MDNSFAFYQLKLGKMLSSLKLPRTKNEKLLIENNLSFLGNNIGVPRVSVVNTGFNHINNIDKVKKFGLYRKVLKPEYSIDLIYNDYIAIIDMYIFDEEKKIINFSSYEKINIEKRISEFSFLTNLHGKMILDDVTNLQQMIDTYLKNIVLQHIEKKEKQKLLELSVLISKIIYIFFIKNNFAIYYGEPKHPPFGDWREWLKQKEIDCLVESSDH